MSLLARRAELDDGFITVSATTNVAVASVDVSSVRERQAAILRERLDDLADRAKGRLVVSMGEVRDMTSACIIALVEVGDRCRALGGRLVIYGLSRKLRKVFRSPRILEALTLAKNADEALRCFEAPRRGFWSLFGGSSSRRDAA